MERSILSSWGGTGRGWRPLPHKVNETEKCMPGRPGSTTYTNALSQDSHRVKERWIRKKAGRRRSTLRKA